MFLLTLGYLYITYLSWANSDDDSTYIDLQLISSSVISVISLIPLYVSYKLALEDNINLDVEFPDIPDI